MQAQVNHDHGCTHVRSLRADRLTLAIQQRLMHPIGCGLLSHGACSQAALTELDRFYSAMDFPPCCLTGDHDEMLSGLRS